MDCTEKNMEICEYAEKVKRIIESVRPDWTISIESFTKCNGLKPTALVVRKENDSKTGISLYLDGMFEKAVPVEQAAKTLMKVADENNGPTLTDVMEKVFGKDGTEKPCIVPVVVSASKNLDMLRNCPHILSGGLAVCFYISLKGVVENQDGYILINQSLVDKFKPLQMSVSEFLKEAVLNTTYQVTDFDSLIKNMFDISEQQVMPMSMYVCTNNTGSRGAFSIFAPGFAKMLSERLGSSLMILPSSIHECIVVRMEQMDETDIQYALEMVKLVNGTEVAPEEVLTDSVYFYNREEDVLYDCITKEVIDFSIDNDFSYEFKGVFEGKDTFKAVVV